MVFPGIFPLVYLLENKKNKKNRKHLEFFGVFGVWGFLGFEKTKKTPRVFLVFCSKPKNCVFSKGLRWFFLVFSH